MTLWYHANEGIVNLNCIERNRNFEQISTVQNAAYMILRGMKTLHLRVQNQNSTALRMAQLLEEHPKVCEGKLYSFYFFYIFYLMVMEDDQGSFAL